MISNADYAIVATGNTYVVKSSSRVPMTMEKIFGLIHKVIVNEEIFGPVLCIMKIKDLDEVLEIINASKYGNAATIYTQNEAAAREFKYRARCGNLGINIGVAAPMALETISQ